MDPMNSSDVLSKNVPGVGWGGVGHAGVGWGQSCRVGWDGVCHARVGWGQSCRCNTVRFAPHTPFTNFILFSLITI